MGDRLLASACLGVASSLAGEEVDLVPAVAIGHRLLEIEDMSLPGAFGSIEEDR